jgi:hypothetical protein
VNLYQFNGNNPAMYTDPFGLCKNADGSWRRCKVELSPEAAKLNGGATQAILDNSPEVMLALQQIADAADVDLGINVLTDDIGHDDPRHSEGLAVDIGYINGEDIGYKKSTRSGMSELAKKVQVAAATLSATLDLQMNLGPAGRYSGMDGPLSMSARTTDQHANHIHFGFGVRCDTPNPSLRGFQCLGQ